MSTMTSNTMTATLDGLALRAVISTSKDQVSVELTLTNGGGVNVYVPDVALDPQTNGLREHVLGVQFEPPGTAVLSARLFPLDPKIRHAHPPVAYTTRLAPGETYKKTLSAKAPLRAAGAQGEAPDIECAHVRFELGLIPEAAGLDPQSMTVEGKVVYRLRTAAYRLQKVMTVETGALKVPLVTK